MLFLHDGTCQYQETTKTLFSMCLLDGMAASGTMEALQACIWYFQNQLYLAPEYYSKSYEKRRDSETSPNTITENSCFLHLQPSSSCLLSSKSKSISPQVSTSSCQVPILGQERCPLTCCFSSEYVDCLRRHVNQASLLSMSVHALYYNQRSMMVCARALSATTMSRLVCISKSLPITVR